MNVLKAVVAEAGNAFVTVKITTLAKNHVKKGTKTPAMKKLRNAIQMFANQVCRLSRFSIKIVKLFFEMRPFLHFLSFLTSDFKN